MAQALQNFRFALRSLHRAPGFTLTALLTLGIGIGFSAAMLGISRQVLLAPLPYAQPERLVALNFGFPGQPASASQTGEGSDFIRQNARSYGSFGVSEGGPTSVNISIPADGTGHAFPVQQLRVSRDFFATLGIAPRLGRGFTADEDRPGGPRAALLSDSMWRTQFSADPKIVGRLIHIDEEDVPVVGVLPPDANADMEGGNREAPAAGIFQPLQLGLKDPGYQGTNYQMIGRLHDGTSIPAAQAELTALTPQFLKQYPAVAGWKTRDGRSIHLFAFPLKAALTGDVRSGLLLLLWSASAVLVIACLNLAGMMVARTTARTRELAVRSALGASRAALLHLVLAEAIVLAIAGAVLGLAVATSVARVFVDHAPLELPRLQPIATVGPLALSAAGLSMLSVLLFGLLPALVVLGTDVNYSLRNAGSQGQSQTYSHISRALIVAQVSLTFVLLTAASLLMHTFVAMRSTPPGISPTQVTIGQVTLRGDVYAKSARYNALTTRVVEQLANAPGISAAGAVNGLPLDRGLNNSGWPTGHNDKERSIETRFVSPGYMRVIGISLLRGRGILPTDTTTATRVAVINQAMARLWWPAGDAIGDRINIGGSGDYEVVGIAHDTKEGSLLEQPRPLAYVPLAQTTDEFTRMINNWFPTTFVVRTAPGVNVAAILADAVRNADPELPLTRVETMQDVVDASMAAPRFFGSMSASVAAFTLLLAAIGLFGLLSYQVTQRTREIGVRMALGATRSNVLFSVLARAAAMTAVGLVLGLLLSAPLPRILSASLPEFAAMRRLSPAQSAELVARLTSASLLLFTAVAACLTPARRASTIDPMHALRAD